MATPEDGYSFSAQRNYHDGVSFDIKNHWNDPHHPDHDHWSLRLAAPYRVTLVPGFYDNAARFPFQDFDQPGLTFSGNHRGNNRNSGHFTVLEAVYGAGGAVESFAVDFTQYGEENPLWWINGRLRYNSDVPYIPEPGTPPVADADGPYSIYVGDSLILDASGSTDADDDIVSYMWDLDDNGSFETDAGGQAIFDVNYTYLQLLGLLVDHTYNIHLKVTDSEGQSDVADSTLIIVPEPATVVAVDIKPGGCPNPLNVKSSGVLPIAILGSAGFDVTTIDPTSVRLAGVEPLRSGYEDVATPVPDGNDCNCITDGPDGFIDLALKFATQGIVEAIGDVNDGDILTLELTGVLFDPIPFETPIEGADCILIRGRHKPINPADINKDGVVNVVDFAIIAENWLQSSIVEE